MTNGNDPSNSISVDLIEKCGDVNFSPFGLTKREYFAAMALQGGLANSVLCQGLSTDEEYCERAVAIADALIEALNKQP